MTEQEMLNSLQTIGENISLNGDRSIYQEMLVILDEIIFLFKEMHIDYPQRVYDEYLNCNDFKIRYAIGDGL